MVPYAAFALSENTAAFLPVFKQALLRRGLPERLYVDNGAAFRSQHLALVCAKLGVALIHARPYQPQGKGKLERWFRTVRAQLIARLAPEDTASLLAALNRRLWAYVEGEYHQAPHRSLGGETPLERWATGEAVAFPEPGLDLDALFLFEATRRVQRDRTVSLAGVVYEVDAALVGEKVTLRYDPAAPPGRPVEVWHEHRRLADATPLDAYANCLRQTSPPLAQLAPQHPGARAQTGARAARAAPAWRRRRHRGGQLMYLRHFALTRFPFQDGLDTDELFDSGAIAEAETRLHHLLELKGIGLLTGEVGCGKTTVCRKVTAALHSGLYRVLYVTLSTGNVMDMYKAIAWELGLPAERNRAGASREIKNEVTRLVTEARQQPVLVIDEAHHLRNDVLEDLRLLTNYQMDTEQRLCLLFIGLTELRRRLAMTVHESLDQRIVVRHHLPGLARDELPGYLHHRLRLAGTELELFTAAATEALFQATNGMPRKINRIAHYAMTAAALDNAREVNEEHLFRAVEELRP